METFRRETDKRLVHMRWDRDGRKDVKEVKHSGEPGVEDM